MSPDRINLEPKKPYSGPVQRFLGEEKHLVNGKWVKSGSLSETEELMYRRLGKSQKRQEINKKLAEGVKA